MNAVFTFELSYLIAGLTRSDQWEWHGPCKAEMPTDDGPAAADRRAHKVWTLVIELPQDPEASPIPRTLRQHRRGVEILGTPWISFS
jgi:hypothetical protein